MRRTRRVHSAAKVFILAFSVYAAFTLVSLQFQIRSKEKEIAQLQDKIDASSWKTARSRMFLTVKMTPST